MRRVRLCPASALDIGGSHADEQHIASNAAVVPPVEDLRGHIFRMTLVVNLHDNLVLAVLKEVGHVVVERCETALMVSGLLTVHIDMGIVVDGSEVEQGATACLWMKLKAALQPYGSFVEEESLVLGVPVARYLHGLSLVEVVFDEVFWVPGLGIDEEAVAHRGHAIVVLLYIDDIVPSAVKRGGLSSQDIGNLRNLGSL